MSITENHDAIIRPTASASDLPDASKRAASVFKYLRELALLRSIPVRDVASYESDGQVLWIAQLPRENGCYTPAWGANRADSSDVWLEVRKPKSIPYPLVPKNLQAWVKESDLAMSSDIPQLLDSVPNHGAENALSDTESATYLLLSDHPEISEAWNRYLEEKWTPWAKYNERVKEVQNVYSKLHEMYLQLKRQGETFELVIGLGILAWQTPSNQRVHRHLIIAQASLEFEADKGVFTVRPSSEGARSTLEEDMLDPADCPPGDVRQQINAEVHAISDDLFARASIGSILSSWVHHLPGARGTYDEDIQPINSVTQDPTVTFAPALILRKRNQRSLVALFDEIIQQIESGISLPPGVLRTVSVTDETPVNDGPDDKDADLEFERILFPLPANEKQREIVESLKHKQGILVQGPPGTGKSHTIVNLICHLLAQGQRVLVTSQTPQALQVLKGKFPAQMDSLCVSLLGNDSGSLKNLENSVQGITNRHSGWNSQQNQLRIEKAESELDKLLAKQAELHLQLREVRERETYKHSICDGEYTGTAQAIAERLDKERYQHEWLVGNISMNSPAPLTDTEAIGLLTLYRAVSEDQERAAMLAYPSPDELLSPQEFEKACNYEHSTHFTMETFSDVAGTDWYYQLEQSNAEQIDALESALLSTVSTWENLRNLNDSWVPSALEDIISGRGRGWQALHESTCQHLKDLAEKARYSNDYRVDIPQRMDRSKVLLDAKALLTYLQSGGKFGIPPFRPKIVKDTWYLVRESRLNGSACDNVDTLQKLINCIEVDEHIDNVWLSWSHYVVRTDDTRYVQVGRLESLRDRLREVLLLEDALLHARNMCRNIPNLVEPAWHCLDEVKKHLRAVDAVRAKKAYEVANHKLELAEKAVNIYVLKPEQSPHVRLLQDAITSRDMELYISVISSLELLTDTRNKIKCRSELSAKLEEVAPALARRIQQEAQLQSWDAALMHFVASWTWAKAKTWLKGFGSGASEDQLKQELSSVQSKISKITEELCALRSWRYCLARLKVSEMQALRAWSHEIGRIGRGTGARAEIHRRAARDNMEQCRSAIPAWIMPLYRVAETVRPGAYAYDVVIIDEASQSGPEALFLQFLAKKIIVVGDDQQISPENVGVQKVQADSLIKTYLWDLSPAQKTALSLEGSFFDLAHIMFGGRIVLNEHFRCVPEIINFSNQLCYHGKLEPVRQYPPNRLRPAVTAIHVREGYREGKSQNARNKPEAEALVNAVVDCCRNSAYKNKTMGVISLLGENQAGMIERMLRDRIGTEEMEMRGIICGDAYAFQGDERHVMFLSMVAAPGDTGMHALTKPSDKRRFNVAASRAQDQLWLFHTPTLNDFRNHDCLRYKLLSYCNDPAIPIDDDSANIAELRANAGGSTNRGIADPPSPFDSWFEVDVYLKIVERGYLVIRQFEVAGYRIDLVIEGIGERLAVECDGDRWHTEPEQRDYDMLRQRVLERCGWQFWRVRGSEFYLDRDKVMLALWEKLDRMEIHPQSARCENDTTLSCCNPNLDQNLEKPMQSRVNKRLPQEKTKDGQRNLLDELGLNNAPINVSKRRALDFTTNELQEAIIEVLKVRSNTSCKKDNLAQEVLSHLKVITHGAPKIEFEKRLSRALNSLKRKGVVQEYKAKNIRVKLVSS